MKNKVVVINLLNRDVDTKQLNRLSLLSRKILELLSLRNKRLEIYLISSQKMRFLNRKFRKKDKSTSILSFPHNPELPPVPFSRFKPLGEIYLSPRAFKQDISYLLVHGILHLLGYVHGQEMEQKEQQLMQDLKKKAIINLKFKN